MGVLCIGYGEIAQFFDAASQYDILGEARYFGSDGTSRLPQLTQDAVACRLAEDTRLICPTFTACGGAKTTEVRSYPDSALQREAGTCSLAAYDVVWAIGLAARTGQTCSTEVVSPHTCGFSYDGALENKAELLRRYREGKL